MNKNAYAPTPPMGWNSYDYYSTTVNEEQIRANAADQAANPSSVCRWNPDMYGIRNCAAGQAYYDSILELYAAWGVDFIKCDDICNTNNWMEPAPGAYVGRHEIEMLAKAIEKQSRPIVLSLSPGPALIDKAWHYKKYSNMWRITDDFWDDWRYLKAMFSRCELWQDHIEAGCYPDCDMLPLGKLGGVLPDVLSQVHLFKGRSSAGNAKPV